MAATDGGVHPAAILADVPRAGCRARRFVGGSLSMVVGAKKPPMLAGAGVASDVTLTRLPST